MASGNIRVLVVDDSAFARKVVRDVLSAEDGIEIVGHARDGAEGLELVMTLQPDVVTLDLSMPDVDGVGFLRALPQDSPPRVVVVSSEPADGALAIEALQAGAVELVKKPVAVANERMYGLRDELVAAVRAAAVARAPVALPPPAPSPRPARESTRPARHAPSASRRARPSSQLLVIGASTGGPQALSRLLRELPAELSVPACVALHIPAGYTEALAARIDAQSAVRVFEASDGGIVEPGAVAFARGGTHLYVANERGAVRTRLSAEPVDAPYRPSVDALFASAADAFGAGVVAVVLTGMGDDGLAGARRVAAAGGIVIAEDASSCVIYGMPRCVVDAGLAREVVPLDAMSAALARYL